MHSHVFTISHWNFPTRLGAECRCNEDDCVAIRDGRRSPQPKVIGGSARIGGSKKGEQWQRGSALIRQVRQATSEPDAIQQRVQDGAPDFTGAIPQRAHSGGRAAVGSAGPPSPMAAERVAAQ
ncbi:unnamed protein product [Prorocentrum cordatum]|uniref:Uncharacterized protein n=1 Tax=Prorocentrum cordatum TaxID=2364126 RepID=A0ABN9V0Z3_9DINO|nr:unnamed protein product [Polarella glacialis]